MYKIRTKEDFTRLIQEQRIPSIIANQIWGDLLMFEEMLKEEYEHQEKSAIVILEAEEFELLSKEYNIDSNTYEYKDVIGVNLNCYIEKLLYIKNNGDTGIIVYKIHNFGKSVEKFDNEIYITKKVSNEIPNDLIVFLKAMIEESRDELLGKLDYLQIFNITNIGNDILKITHLQEKPKHSKIYYLSNMKCENCKLYWISDYDGKKKKASFTTS